jgi:hypothetical protein
MTQPTKAEEKAAAKAEEAQAKVDEKEARAEARAEAAKPKLAPAAESGDAAVHNLMAQRAGFAANDMAEAMAEVDRQLAELGYTA